MKLRTFQAIVEAAGIFLLSGCSVFAQTQVGENFGVSLDPSQKTAQQLHGGFYHLTRSDALDARNFFAASVSPYLYQDYRFALAGPVQFPRLLSRRKTWFFALGYAVNSDRRPDSRRGLAPTAEERAGDFHGSPLCTEAFRAQFADCRVAESSWSRNGAALLSRYPLPNTEGAGFNHALSAVQRVTTHQYTGRLEWARPGRWKAGLRVASNISPQRRLFEGSPLGNAPVLRRRADQAVGLRVTTTVNAKTINAFSLTISRGGQADIAAASLNRGQAAYSAPELFAENPGDLLPGVNITGVTAYSAGRSLGYANRSLVVRNDLSRSAGKHEWRFGAQWTRSLRESEISSLPAGSITFARGANSTGNPLADVLLGRFSSYQEGRSIPVRLGLQQLEPSLADRWKLHARFSLDYGLSWQWMPVERRLNGPLANFAVSQFDGAAAPELAPDGTLAPGSDPRNGMLTGSSTRLLRLPLANFAPRAGISWQPFKKKKLNVRAGGGVSLDRLRIDPSLANNPPAPIVTLLNGSLDNLAGAARVASRPLSVLALDRALLNPTVYNANARIEQEWRRHTWAAEYRSTLARHLLRQRNLNQLPPGALLNANGAAPDALRPFRGYATVTFRETGGNSSYHAVEFSLAPRKAAAGLSYRLRYTFSKVLSDSTGESALPQDNFNLRNDRGPAAFDRRHVLVLEYSYLPKFGAWMPACVGWLVKNWELYGTSNLSTGGPFDVTQPGDRALTGGGVQRPDLVADPALARADRTLRRYFNAEAFRSPALGALGNASRLLVYGPGTNTAGLSLARVLVLSKRVRGYFRADASNVFNHPSFTAIGTTFDPATYQSPSSTFGRVTAAAPGRSLVLSFRLTF